MEVISHKRSLTGWAVFQIIEAALLIVIGLLTAVFAGRKDFQYALGIITGTMMIVDATTRIVIEFVQTPVNEIRMNIITWILELAFGIFVCIIARDVIGYLCLIIALMMTVIGAIILLITILKTVKKDTPGLWLSTGYVAAMLLIALGITALCFHPSVRKSLSPEQGNDTISIMLICFGVLLVVLAITEITFTFIIMNRARKREHDLLMRVVNAHEEERKKAKAASKERRKKESSRKEIQAIEVITPRKKSGKQH